jgi:hypothetical protein
MKMHNGLAVAAVSTLLSACTLQGGIEQSALDYNRAADRVDKELLLLNIARAAHGESMTFTGIAEMRGSFTVKVGGSANIPFGGAADPKFVFSPNASYQTSPSTKIVPLATADFQKGIINSVTPEILLLLWERGWPKELLLHLMIEKVVMKVPSEIGLEADTDQPCLDLADNRWKEGWKKTKLSSRPKWVETSEDGFSHTCEFDNEPEFVKTPEDGEEFGKEFKDFQEFLGWAKLTPYNVQKKGEPVGPSFKENNLYGLRVIAESHDGDLKLKQIKEEGPKKGEFYLESKGKSRIQFVMSKTLRPNTVKSADFSRPELVGQSFDDRKGLRLIHSVASEDSDRAKVQVRIHLRSPQGMIFYLGEIVRASGREKKKVEYQKIYNNKECDLKTRSLNNKEYAELLRSKGCLVPIFVGWIGEGDAEVAVDLRGDRYFVPAGREPPENEPIAGRSLMAMALVRALFNMQTSREDLPTTQTVITSGPTL